MNDHVCVCYSCVRCEQAKRVMQIFYANFKYCAQYTYCKSNMSCVIV